jgi:hypothetical protein
MVVSVQKSIKTLNSNSDKFWDMSENQLLSIVGTGVISENYAEYMTEEEGYGLTAPKFIDKAITAANKWYAKNKSTIQSIICPMSAEINKDNISTAIIAVAGVFGFTVLNIPAFIVAAVVLFVKFLMAKACEDYKKPATAKA